MEARLSPLMAREQIATLNDLCALMRATAGSTLRQQVVEAMTTNETLFFRDPVAFEALRNFVFPDLVKRNSVDRKLRIWSAAASSGQEAYSVAMLLLDMKLTGWSIEILGTDLNHQILEKAKKGRFAQVEVNRGLSPEHLKNYFSVAGKEWQICQAARNLVNFRPFDLRGSMQGFGAFDLIMCRNVLIYFDIDTKKKILAELQTTLGSNGLLLLGCAESTLNLSTTLAKKLFGQATFYRNL